MKTVEMYVAAAPMPAVTPALDAVFKIFGNACTVLFRSFVYSLSIP